MNVNHQALKALRERSGLNITELAELADIKRPHLCNIEAGRRTASPALVTRLARALKVPVVALIQDQSPPETMEATS